jgi:hypothetical protein
VHGTLAADADVDVVEGDIAAGRFVARYRRAGTVIGVLGWNMPKQARLRRKNVVDALDGLDALDAPAPDNTAPDNTAPANTAPTP